MTKLLRNHPSLQRKRSLLWDSLQKRTILWPMQCQIFLQVIQRNQVLVPKNVKQEPKKYVEKKEYGKVPGYLTKHKNEIEEEYKLIKEMQVQEEETFEKQKYLVSEEEKKQLVDALKKKWDVIHHEYQAIITRVTKVNPLGLKTLKENLEKEMAQIEKDIEKLNKNYIFVDAAQ